MKLKSILDKAEKDIDGQGDLSECIEMLRLAAQEFPSEPQVFVKLGYALYMQGWSKYGARSYTKDGSDYSYEDIEYNSKNVYWQEALTVFERVLTIDDSIEDRDAVILLMVIVYGKMGYNEKAKALAQKQNSIIMSREVLLPRATGREEGDKYRGEAIIALLTELKNVIEVSIASKISVFTTEKALIPLMALINLYKAVFNDGNYGIAHSHMRDLYLRAAIQQDRFGEKAEALECFREAFRHNNIYKSIRNCGEYHYTATLVSNVTFPAKNFPEVPHSFYKVWLSYFTEELRERIKKDPEFEECFM